MGTYTLSTSSGLPSFFLSEYLSSRYGIILQMRKLHQSLGTHHGTESLCCFKQVRRYSSRHVLTGKSDALLVTVV